MKMIPVVSSNIKCIGYDEKTKALRIQFRNGTYEYSNVPKDVYDELMDSESIGAYATAHIVKGGYQYKKV